MPNNTIGNITRSYMGSLQWIDMPEINKALINVNPEANFASLFFQTESIVHTPADIYKTRYAYPNYNSVPLTGTTVTASGSAGTGYIATITNVPAAVFNTIKEGRLLYANSSNQRVRVQSLSSPGGVNTVVVQNVRNVPVSISNTETLLDFSSAMPIASGKQTGRLLDFTYLENQIQAIRSGIEWDDATSGNTNQGYGLRDKETGENIMLEWGWLLSQRRHRADIAKTLLMGQKSDTQWANQAPILTGTNGNGLQSAVQTTHGFDAYMDDYALKDNAATQGVYTNADHKRAIAKLAAQMVPTDLNVFGSTMALTTFSDYIKNLSGTGIPSARLEMNGKAADLDIEKVTRGGYTWNFVPQEVFNSTEVSDRLRTGVYLIPSGSVPVYDIAGGGSTGYMSVRSFTPKGPGAKDGQYTYLTYDGALSAEPTGHIMNASTNWTSYLGFEMPAAQMCMRIGNLA